MNDPVIVREPRRFRFSLRALLLLAIPMALIACFLKAWLPWLSPRSPDAAPSDFFASLNRSQLESVIRQHLPKGRMFNSTRSRSIANDVTPKTGKWLIDWNGSLVCYSAESDRALRMFRMDLLKTAKLGGGEISDEQEYLEGTLLAGFRFVYVRGQHVGEVEVVYGAEKPFGAFPDKDPPFRRLRVRIEESTGFKQRTAFNSARADISRPETSESVNWQARKR